MATEEFLNFLERITALANLTRSELVAAPDEARFEIVERLITEADVAFAVWQAPDATGGVDFLLVKGNQLASEVLATGTEGVPARTVAIPCADVDQATALVDMLGEPDLRH